jgi:cold-inducible RNA-binding protein
MSEILHVGNLADVTTDQQLHDLFARSGVVLSAQVMTETQTGKPRGFGLVEMSTPEETASAIKAVGGRDLDGRAVTVRLLPPRAEGWGGGNGEGGRNRSHGMGTGNGGSRW